MAVPGEHIPVGQGLLEPHASAGLEFSSNAFHSEDPGEDATGTNLVVAPGADYKLVLPKVTFTAMGTYELRKYFLARVTPLDRYDDFVVRGDLDALKLSHVGFRLNEAVGQLNRPVDAESADRAYTKELKNQSMASLVVRPGSTLDLIVGGRYVFDDFRATLASGQGSDNVNTRTSVGPSAGLAWRFFPLTTLSVDFSLDRSSYAETAIQFDNGESSYTLFYPDHEIMRVVGGIRGQVGRRVGLTLLGGYVAADFDETSIGDIVPAAGTDVSGIEHLLVEVGLHYDLTQNGSLVLSLEKDIRQSFFTNYVAYNTATLTIDNRFNRRWGAAAEGSVSTEAFRGQATRDDVLGRASAHLAYNLQDWATLTVGPGWAHRWSDDGQVEYEEYTAKALLNVVY